MVYLRYISSHGYYLSLEGFSWLSLYQILTFVSQFFSMSKFIKARNQTHNYYEIVDTKLLGNVKMSDNVVVVEDKFNSGL